MATDPTETGRGRMAALEAIRRSFEHNDPGNEVVLFAEHHRYEVESE